MKRSVVVRMGLLVIGVALVSGFVGVKFGKLFTLNRLCCQIPRFQRIILTTKEMLGLTSFYSQFGQDKWVTEKIFPGLKNGFFLDVGSWDGTIHSNTKALEQRNWTGICIDPFPTNMHDRTCQMFKEVVYSKAGERVKFHKAAGLSGIADTLGEYKDVVQNAPAVELTTSTLRDILERAKAPRFIHFMSLDIEGAELEALKSFPFDKHHIGALVIEHNHESSKRAQIEALLKSHGYKRVHTWSVDDYYLPINRG